MALIIRKLEKGNKIKKYENPAKELDFSASAITGNSNSSNSNSGITDFSKLSISGNSQTSNLDFSANSIIGKPKPETPKTITFKKNGLDTNWTIDDIKNMMIKVQDRTLANKQLNTKESTEANNWLLQLIENAKESVDITNKGIYIDGIAITTPEAFYEGYDGLLRKKYSKNYAGDLLARQAGVILEDSNNFSGTGAGTRYSPFDLPTLNVTVTPEKKEGLEEEEVEKTADLLAVDAFNKTHGTTGTYNRVRFVDPADNKWKNYYVFNKGNGDYYLAVRDANGNYLKVEDDLNYLRYDDHTNPNYGNIYTGVGGTYRLINKDTVSSESSEYQSTFKTINDELENRFSTIIENVKNQFNNKLSYYNPYVSAEDKPYVNIGTNFSKVGKYSDISSVYVDANSPKTHFGQFDIPSLSSGIIVKGDTPIKVNLILKDGKYFAIDPNDNNKEYDLGNLSAFLTVGENPYQEINYDYFKAGENVIGHDDIFNRIGDFRVEDSNHGDRNDDDEFLEYENAIDAITRTVNKLITSPAFYSDFSKNLQANFNGLVNFADKYEKKHGKGANLYRLRYDIQRLYNYILEKQQASQQIPSQKKGGTLRMYQSGGAYLALKNNPDTVYKDYSKVTAPDLVYNPKRGKEYATLDNEWGWTDTLRGVAVGADAVALAGGYVGLGAGIGATALEAVADVADAINGLMEWGTVLKNVGINIGFTILSLLPGASSLKAAKSGIKGGAKLVKSLNKLEKVADVARSAGKADDAAAIMKAADEALDIKDVKNIITSAESILKNKKIVNSLSKAQIDEASALLETCQKAIKIQEKVGVTSKVLGTVGKTVNAGMTAYGLSAGALSVGSITNKIIEGNGSDISLGDIHGLIAGVAGVKGARNLFKTYATRRALVDKTQTNSDVNIPLKHGDIEINITSKGKSPSKVKAALKSEIATLKAKQVELEAKVKNSTGGEKATALGELDLLKNQIKNYETIESNFKTAYDGNWTNTVEDVGNTVKGNFNSFVKSFKQPDYTQKRLITDAENPSWILRKGREYAKKEGFTEEGFTVEDYQIPKGYYQKRLKIDKVKLEIQSLKSETLVGRAISKVTKSKSKSGKAIEKVLSELKGESFSAQLKSKLIEAINNNNSFTDKNKLIEIVNSLKKGGSVKSKIEKYNNGKPIGNAYSSSEDITDPEKDPDLFIPYPLRTRETSGGGGSSAQINKKPSLLNNLAVVPEAMSIAAKTVTAGIASKKSNELLQGKEAAKLQYPSLHLPVQEDLASQQYQKDLINAGRANLNKNQTSDSTQQKAIELEYERSVADSIGKLNALRSQDLKDLRLKSFNLEYTNEQNRINVANQNNAIDVSLADYKRGLEANKILTLALITNANLDLNWVLFNKMMDSANSRQLVKYKDLLTLNYYNDTDWHNEYINKYDTYEKSPMIKYQTALGINKDQIVTQDLADSLYNKYLTQFPNLSEDLKNYIKSNFDSLVGKTLQQSYEDAYKWHENHLLKLGRQYQSNMTMADADAEASKYFVTGNTFRLVPFFFKKGGSFAETKYKTDSKSKDHHKKIALEYAKLMHKQHQEAIKNSLPFILHSYKNTTKA